MLLKEGQKNNTVLWKIHLRGKKKENTVFCLYLACLRHSSSEHSLIPMTNSLETHKKSLLPGCLKMSWQQINSALCTLNCMSNNLTLSVIHLLLPVSYLMTGLQTWAGPIYMSCLNTMLTIPGAGPHLMSLVYYTNINNNYLEENLPFSSASWRDASKQN